LGFDGVSASWLAGEHRIKFRDDGQLFRGLDLGKADGTRADWRGTTVVIRRSRRWKKLLDVGRQFDPHANSRGAR
jgi:hypothetical protein